MLSSIAACMRHVCRAFFSSASTCNAARLVKKPPDLVEWITSEGGFVHRSVMISKGDAYGGGLGLTASDGITEGSDLVVLPSHLLLSFTVWESDFPGRMGSVLVEMARSIPEELWSLRLGLKLLQERASNNSFWWPYISNLPETYSVPIFFSGEDVQSLQYAPLLSQINKRCRFLLKFEKELKVMLDDVQHDNHPFGGKDVDASTLGWAMSAVSSRAFSLRHKGLQVRMMLPLIDMMNHSFAPNARIIQELEAGTEEVFVKVVASESIKRDDQLLLNYGCFSNDFFLLDYGFVVPSNPYECVEFTYDSGLFGVAASMIPGISNSSFFSPSPWQQNVLSQLNLVGDHANIKVSLGGAEKVDGRLLAALRAMLTDDEETAQKVVLSDLRSLSARSPLGDSVEIAVYRTLIAVCAIALQHFPTKIQEDEALIEKGEHSESTKLAVQFRIQKKSVLVDLINYLQQRSSSLLSIKQAL